MEHGLAFYISKLRKDFAHHCDNELRKYKLTDGLFYFIIYIGKHDRCTPGNISAALHMDNGHTTRSVDKLVALGYVVRERNEADHRVVFISLTPLGKNIFDRIECMSVEWEDYISKNLDEGDKKQLIKLLETIFAQASEDFFCDKY